ncbi:MAG: hypothetical protein QOD12_2012 [Verrucomicrobiota bacterium]
MEPQDYGNGMRHDLQCDGRGDRFFYDAEGQLTNAYYECTDPTGNFNSWRDGDVYNYDALGNRAGGSWVSSLGSVSDSRYLGERRWGRSVILAICGEPAKRMGQSLNSAAESVSSRSASDNPAH